MTIAIYLRISHDPLSLRAGVERQSTDCHVLAAKHWRGEAIQIYEDNDKSAYSGTRPDFARLCRDISTSQITAVIGYDLDRMFRQPRELEAFIDLCQLHKLTRVLTAKGDLDLTSHDGQLHARILTAVAKKSSDDNSRRVKRAALDRAESGRWHGGIVPYGYLADDSKGLIVDPPAAADVLLAAQHVARGMSIADVTRLHAGPKTRTGWRLLLQSPTIAGYTRLHADATWPAIVPRDIWLEVQTILQSRLQGSRVVYMHWLTGILECSVCHVKCGAHNTNQYVCKNGAHVAIKRQWAEDTVAGMLFDAVLVQPRAIATSTATSTPTDGKLTELALDYANGLITRAEWLAVRDALVQTTPTPVRALPAPIELEQIWKGLTPAEKHQMAARMLVKVSLLPASRGRWILPKDRLMPEWKL